MPSDDFRDVPARTIHRLGYIPRWLVCGPFPAGEEREIYRLYRMGRLDVPDLDPLGGEQFVQPHLGVRQRSDAVPHAEVEWSKVDVASPHLNLISLFPTAEYGIAYVASYVSSPTDQLFICDFRPQMLGRMILNHRILSPDSGLLQVPLKTGRNLLLVKVLGGSIRGITWGAICHFMRAKAIGDTGLALTAPKWSRFFRGTAKDPEMEVEFVVANTSKRDALDVATRISCEEAEAEISRSIEVVRRGETLRIRNGLPIDPEGVSKDRLKLEVIADSTKISASSPVEDVKPPKSDATIYVGQGFHCDPIWTNTQSMYNDISLNNVTQFLNFCRADPEFKVILHELDYLKPYLDFYPGDRDYLKGLARQGRVIAGGSYNEPNEKNISGEHIIRNIIYGRLFASSQLGVEPKIYHAWDVFGHVPQLSQILSKSGFIGTVWSKHIKGFPTLFRYMSLDGTTILHRRISYSFATNSFEEIRERAYAGLGELKSLGHSCDLRMDTNDFKSPTAWMLGRSAELKSLLPSIEIADPAKFFERVMDEESSVLIPVTSRDASQYHIGTCQSRIELKMANRLAEVSLYNAELLSTLASLYGRPYPDHALDKAWRQVIFNSHHDAITGTSCDISYLDMMQGYREALYLAGREVRSAADYLAKEIDTHGAEAIPLVVFNTLNWKRTDVVRAKVFFETPIAAFDLMDPSGKKMSYALIATEEDDGGISSATIEFVARDVPSAGYSTYSLRPLSQGRLSRWRSREGLSIENEFYRVTVDPSRGGGLSSIIDKQTGRELVPPGARHQANEIAILKEKNDRYEPSWELYTTGEKMFSGEYPAEVSLESSGPCSRIVDRSKIGDTCELVSEVWLRRGIRRIDLRTEIRGYEKEDDLFVALFPQDLEGGAPTYEERFGAIVKHRGRRAFDYRTWRMDAFSDCVIHSSQNFFDFGSTTKVRFLDAKAKTVASLPLGSVGLILPHSKEVRLISQRLQKGLVNRGVLTTPMFDDDDRPRREKLIHEHSTEAKEKNQDLGNTNFRIAVGLSGNNSYSISVLGTVQEPVLQAFRDRIVKLGFDFLLTLDPNVPKDWDPVPVLIIEARSRKHLERAVDFLVDGLKSGDLILPQHANGIGGSNVEEYGLSVINRGNMANTIEPDGTMTLFLMHTSNWSRQHMEEKLVPERKDHVFLYSLYPHPGSWREARSYRRGWEVNVPLLAVQTDSHKGKLPCVHSFLELTSDSAVLSALKPVGNPIAGFESSGWDRGRNRCHTKEGSSPSSDARKGIVIRLYEAEGRTSEGQLKFSFPVKSVWKTDLMENRSTSVEGEGDTFSISLDPFSIETFEVEPDLPAPEVKTEETRSIEAVQPVYTRYWKENLGAAPMGFQPVAISIQGSPVTEAGGRGTTINRLSVNVVNNYVDRPISGNAILEAPSGWRVEPKRLWVDIPPQGQQTYDVVLSFSGLRRTGLFRARFDHEGQIYEDVIEIGEQSRLTYTGGGSVYQDVLKTQIERSVKWYPVKKGDRLFVRIHNPYNEHVDGGMALITPLETWAEEEVVEYSVIEISPPVQAFHIPPKSFVVLEFNLGGTNPHFWAYAKLFYMGRTEYKRIM